MKKAVLPICVVAAGAWAQEPGAEIESVSLFKNGLAVVQMSCSIPEGGQLEIATLPELVHGTLWIDGENPVTAKVDLRLTSTPLAAISQPELLQGLTGTPVTLHLHNDTITGTILGETLEQQKEWDRDYAMGSGIQAWRYRRDGVGSSSGQAPNMTFIESDDGKIVAIQPGQIQRIEFAGLPEIQRERPVLTLSSPAGGSVSIEYLTKGLAWAPSYRIDLSDPERLVIAQSTVIRNELIALRDVEFRLISGFPSVRFGSVDSPLSPDATWQEFFHQLFGQGGDRHGQGTILSNVMSQRVRVAPQPAEGAAALGPADEGEGVDLHYQPIGRHSLAPGESLSLQVAEARASYERVVEWNIPDTRAPNGRYLRDHERADDPEHFDDTPWDAIVFRNPFEFPMTTAPATLMHAGNFQGQQVSTWTNPGEQTSVRVTQALSVSARSVENEIADSRQNLRIAGNDYYKVQVQGVLTVKNRRGNPATLAINRRFSGELLEAGGDPEQELLESGIYSINKRNELSWRVELEPGEENKIDYRYEVLVAN